MAISNSYYFGLAWNQLDLIGRQNREELVYHEVLFMGFVHNDLGTPVHGAEDVRIYKLNSAVPLMFVNSLI